MWYLLVRYVNSLSLKLSVNKSEMAPACAHENKNFTLIEQFLKRFNNCQSQFFHTVAHSLR
jgi:hypothetical protein